MESGRIICAFAVFVWLFATSFLLGAPGDIYDCGISGISSFSFTFPYDASVNDEGVVALSRRTDDGANIHAYRWSLNGVTDLGAAKDDGDSFGYGINNAGTVVGGDLGDGAALNFRAKQWPGGGSVQDLGTLGFGTFARDINDDGVIVGWSVVSTSTRLGPQAFQWTAAGGMRPLDDLGSNSGAYAINENGEMAGGAWNGSHMIPVMWSANGELQPLSLGTATDGDVFDINDAGQMVGDVHGIGGSDHIMAWLHGPTDPIDLGPGGDMASLFTTAG